MPSKLTQFLMENGFHLKNFNESVAAMSARRQSDEISSGDSVSGYKQAKPRQVILDAIKQSDLKWYQRLALRLRVPRTQFGFLILNLRVKLLKDSEGENPNPSAPIVEKFCSRVVPGSLGRFMFRRFLLGLEKRWDNALENSDERTNISRIFSSPKYYFNHLKVGLGVTDNSKLGQLINRLMGKCKSTEHQSLASAAVPDVSLPRGGNAPETSLAPGAAQQQEPAASTAASVLISLDGAQPNAAGAAMQKTLSVCGLPRGLQALGGIQLQVNHSQELLKQLSGQSPYQVLTTLFAEFGGQKQLDEASLIQNLQSNISSAQVLMESIQFLGSNNLLTANILQKIFEHLFEFSHNVSLDIKKLVERIESVKGCFNENSSSHRMALSAAIIQALDEHIKTEQHDLGAALSAALSTRL